MKPFHVLLRETRRSVGITQRDLARLAHVSRSSLLAYELRRRHPTRETLCRVLDSLAVEGNAVHNLATHDPTLEDVFVAIVGRGIEEEATPGEAGAA